MKTSLRCLRHPQPRPTAAFRQYRLWYHSSRCSNGNNSNSRGPSRSYRPVSLQKHSRYNLAPCWIWMPHACCSLTFVLIHELVLRFIGTMELMSLLWQILLVLFWRTTERAPMSFCMNTRLLIYHFCWLAAESWHPHRQRGCRCGGRSSTRRGPRAANVWSHEAARGKTGIHAR